LAKKKHFADDNMIKEYLFGAGDLIFHEFISKTNFILIFGILLRVYYDITVQSDASNMFVQ
jgi:hypothetical protein